MQAVEHTSLTSYFRYKDGFVWAYCKVGLVQLRLLFTRKTHMQIIKHSRNYLYLLIWLGNTTDNVKTYMDSQVSGLCPIVRFRADRY